MYQHARSCAFAGLKPHLWMFRSGALTQCEAWLRDMPPNVLTDSLTVAPVIRTAVTLAALLPKQKSRRLFANGFAACLSIVATSRKVGVVQLADRVDITDEFLPLLEWLVDRLPMQHDAESEFRFLMRCIILQLLPLLVQGLRAVAMPSALN